MHRQHAIACKSTRRCALKKPVEFSCFHASLSFSLSPVSFLHRWLIYGFPWFTSFTSLSGYGHIYSSLFKRTKEYPGQCVSLLLCFVSSLIEKVNCIPFSFLDASVFSWIFSSARSEASAGALSWISSTFSDINWTVISPSHWFYPTFNIFLYILISGSHTGYFRTSASRKCSEDDCVTSEGSSLPPLWWCSAPDQPVTALFPCGRSDLMGENPKKSRCSFSLVSDLTRPHR